MAASSSNPAGNPANAKFTTLGSSGNNFKFLTGAKANSWYSKYQATQQAKQQQASLTPTKTYVAKAQQQQKNQGNFLTDTINNVLNNPIVKGVGQAATTVNNTLDKNPVTKAINHVINPTVAIPDQLKMAINIAQSIPRGVKEAGISLGNEPNFTPKGPVETALYGSAPVKGVSATGKDQLAAVGIKNAPKPVNTITGGILDALNYVGVGAAKDAVAKEAISGVGQGIKELAPGVAKEVAATAPKVAGREADALQTAIEKAHNAGDVTTVQKLIPQLPKDLQSSTYSALGVNKPLLAKLTTAKEGDVTAAPLANQYIQKQYETLGSKIQQAGSKLSENDKQLISKIEVPKTATPAEASAQLDKATSQADNPKQFAKTVSAIQDFTDARHANDVHLGRDVGYIPNYLPRYYKPPSGEAAQALESHFATNPLPGYTHGRDIATQAEADALASIKNADGTPKYPQLQRANANPLEDVKQAVGLAQADHGKQAFAQALEQAHPGVKVGFGKGGSFDTGSKLPYSELKVAGGKGLSVPDYLANAYNKRALNVPKDAFAIKLKDGSTIPVKDRQLVQKLKETGGQLINPVTGKSLHSNKVARMVASAKADPLGGYDKVNANLKYSILGGGTFHAITTAGTVGGQQLIQATKNLVLHPTRLPGQVADNLKLVASTFSKKANDAVNAVHEADGSLGFAHQIGVTLSPKEIAADADSGIVDSIKHTKFNPISQIHDAIFTRQIPQAKMMIMKQDMLAKFPKMDFNNPTAEQVAYGRREASAVNNLGGINRAVDGLTPQAAKQLSRGLLATDFTEGKARILYNALSPTKWASPEGRVARQMVVGKSVLFALPGLAALTLSGKLDWSNQAQVNQAIVSQLTDPQIALGTKGAPSKSNPGGTPQAIHLPNTFISEIAKIIQPALDPNSPNKAQGAIDYATNRLAAAPAIASRLIQNKDFYGNPIYGQDKQGNPISPLQAVGNVANQVSPIPVAQATKQASGQQPLRDTLLNTAGLRVSADTTSPESQHTKAITDFFNTRNMLVKQQAPVKKQINDLVAQGNINQAKRVADSWNKSLNARVTPFRSQYAANYNPAWDDTKQGFGSFFIKTTGRAFTTRQKNNVENSKILSPNY